MSRWPAPRLSALAVALAVAAGSGAAAGCAAGPERVRPASDAPPPAPRFQGSGFAACPAPVGPATADSPFAGLELPCMDGSGRTLALGKPTGLPTVVNLWASWCGPCAEEIPAFVAFAARAAGKARVVGVNTGDDPGNAVAAAQEARVRFANVYDRDQRARRALGVAGLPATVFVAADGRVVHVYNGPALDQPTLELLVEKHLGVVLT